MGALGIHKFILGYKQEGIIQLSSFLGFMVIVTVLSVVTCGVGSLLFLLAPAFGIVGIVEGIIYLTKSDEDFVNIYLRGRRGWF